jgi:hypothetical protein
VLVNVQQALGVSPTPVQPTAAPDSSTVPAPRDKKSTGESGDGKRTRAKKATDTRTADNKSAAKKPASKTGASKAVLPTLVELIRSHLTGQSDPRSAAEVATALDTAHPERGIKTTVVRTTLENLVAKNQAQRTKQGSSVYYTAPNPVEQTAAQAKDELPSD